jgi:hypothetical protein
MISKNSRNTLTDVVKIVDVATGSLTRPAFLDIRQRVTAKAVDDRFIVADGAHQWSHHGKQQLGAAVHWWVICDLTEIVDPFAELVPGKQLRVPSVERLLFSILSTDETERSK